MEGGEGTASGGGAADDGAAAQQQQAATLSQAQKALQGTAGQGGEAQVAAAMKALEAVRSVMVAQGRSEQEVLAALHAAAADNRQVVASDTRPGPDWQPLLPQELGAEESVLAETGRDGIIGDAAVDPDSYVCEACGGVVARRRREAHDLYWCGAVDSDEDGSDDGGGGDGET